MKLPHKRIEFRSFFSSTISFTFFLLAIFTFLIGFSVEVREETSSTKNEVSRTFLPTPEKVKGIYYRSRQIKAVGLKKIIDQLKKHGFNALVINVKNTEGEITFASQNKLAKEVGSIRQVLDFADVVSRCHKRGVYVIARQVVFRDPLLVRYLGERGEWVNPLNDLAINYNLDIAREVVQFGVDEIQLDYVRFDDDSDIGRDYAQRSTVITNFVQRVSSTIPPSVNFSVDVFGRTLWDWNSENKDPIGQNLDQLGPFLDYISPMIYPSHYSNPDFVNDPYNCVKKSLESGLSRLDVSIRPFIQGFVWSIPQTMTLSQYIQQQIKAVDEAGITTFLVWNPRADYKALWETVEQL